VEAPPIRPKTFQAESRTLEETPSVQRREFHKSKSTLCNVKYDHSLNFAAHCCTSGQLDTNNVNDYGVLNKVTKQGKEVTSATWAVPIRCISFRKLEKRASKVAEDEFGRNRDTSQWLR
jgi:hypothetical protein